MAYGLNDGRALVARHGFKVTYPNDVRKITAVLSYPPGQPVEALDEQGRAIEKLAVRNAGESATVAAILEMFG